MENKVDQRLVQIINKIERLEVEKKEVADQITEVYKEASSCGFQTKIIKKIVAMRKKDNAELQEEEYLIETYKNALGMS